MTRSFYGNFCGTSFNLAGGKACIQSVAADAVGINLRTYHRYENGEREATVSTLIRMADYFGVSIDYLVGRTDSP